MPDTYGFHTAPTPFEFERFYVASIGSQIWRGDSRLLRRGHRYHLLMFTTTGRATGKVNDDVIYAEENSAWIFPRNKTYTYTWDPQFAQWNYFWVEFDGAWASSYLEMMRLDDRHEFHGCEAARPFLDRLTKLLLDKGNDAQHEASALLLQAFSHMEQAKHQPQRNKQVQSLDSIVKKYLADHLGENIQLEEIAEHVQLSPFHLSRVFKDHNGISPMKYLRQLRIARAKTLFNRRDMNISEVGQAVGYPIIQHFSRMFKSETGMSPRAYVKAL